MKVRLISLKDKALLTEVANELLVPLYGDQSRMIKSWYDSNSDKNAFVAVGNDDMPKGFLCLKNNPNKNYIKISTLMVFPLSRNMGIGSLLIRKAYEYANALGAEELSVTVSQERHDSLSFFLKNGFVIVKCLHGKYKKDVTEFVLVKKLIHTRDLRMKSKYLDQILSGKKSLECRVKHAHINKIELGDRVILFNQHAKKSVIIRINEIREYSSIQKMLEFEDFNQLIPGFMSSKQVSHEYQKFYDDEKVARLGGVRVFDFDIV